MVAVIRCLQPPVHQINSGIREDYEYDLHDGIIRRDEGREEVQIA